MQQKNDWEGFLKYDGSFADKQKELDYLNSQWVNVSKRIRIVSIVTGLAYLTGVISDKAILGATAEFNYMLIARLVTLTAALLCFVISFKKIGAKNAQRIMFLYMMTITASECLELVIYPGVGEQGLPVLLFIILCYYLVFPVELSYAVRGSFLATAAYLVVLIFIIDIPFQTASPTIVSFLVVIVFSYHFVRNMNRAKRVEALAIAMLTDEIEERKRVQAKFEALATTDELTQIYNRRQFDVLAKRELHRAERTNRSVSLLFMDIDFFKKINDTYGHDAGDRILSGIAALCGGSLRELDIFGRYGGEEFVLILPEIGLEQATQTAERLRILIEGTRFTLENDEINITASFGVAVYDKNKTETLEKLIKIADKALYEAKADGRNRVKALDE